MARSISGFCVALALFALAGQALGQGAQSGTVGRSASTMATQIGGRDSSGNLRVPRVDSNGDVHVTGSVSLSGGGDATAANQTSQITQETAINTVLGTVTASPTANTIADRLKTLNTSLGTINTTLGTPLQAGGNVVVTGNLTNISGTISLPTGASTEATLAAQSAKLPASLGTKAASASLSVTGATEDVAQIGSLTETAPATDTASSGLNGRLQRIAQRLTTINTTLGTPMQAGGSLAANQSTNIAQINGVTPLMGNGVTGTGSLRVTLASDTTSNTNPFAFNQTQVNGVTMLAGNGATGTGSQRVTIASDNTKFETKAERLEYETVAASQTNQVMGATGGTGDYLSHCVIQPTSTAPGVATILDNAVELYGYPGGTVGADLRPWTIAFGIPTVSGAVKVTTGANVKVTCYGDFL